MFAVLNTINAKSVMPVKMYVLPKCRSLHRRVLGVTELLVVASREAIALQDRERRNVLVTSQNLKTNSSAQQTKHLMRGAHDLGKTGCACICFRHASMT